MKQIEELPTNTIIRLLTSINKQFLVFKKHGVTIEDNETDMFDLYINVSRNMIENKDVLMQEHRFTENMNYDGWLIYLLNLELSKRGVDKPKFKSKHDVLLNAHKKLNPFTPFEIKDEFKLSNLLRNNNGENE